MITLTFDIKKYYQGHRKYYTVFKYLYVLYENEVRFIGDDIFFKGMTAMDFKTLWKDKESIVNHLNGLLMKCSRDRKPEDKVT